MRRLNYTGRQRLLRDDTRITLVERPGYCPAFDAALSFDGYGLPEEALVFVEAYRQTAWMRFDFGTVGQLMPPEDRRLLQFDNPDGLLFRVRVTSASPPHGVLLAEGDRIPIRRPEDQEDNRIPLLEVQREELDELVYRVDFENGPVLMVNQRVGDHRAVAKLPAFAALVYPAAFREILTRILRIEKYEYDPNEEDGTWEHQWLTYAKSLPGVTPPPEDLSKESAVFDWIDEAAAAFGRSHQMMTRFGEFLTKEGAQ